MDSAGFLDSMFGTHIIVRQKWIWNHIKYLMVALDGTDNCLCLTKCFSQFAVPMSKPTHGSSRTQVLIRTRKVDVSHVKGNKTGNVCMT
jgi:hypothetical protein